MPAHAMEDAVYDYVDMWQGAIHDDVESLRSVSEMLFARGDLKKARLFCSKAARQGSIYTS